MDGARKIFVFEVKIGSPNRAGCFPAFVVMYWASRMEYRNERKRKSLFPYKLLSSLPCIECLIGGTWDAEVGQQHWHG